MSRIKFLNIPKDYVFSLTKFCLLKNAHLKIITFLQIILLVSKRPRCYGNIYIYIYIYIYKLKWHPCTINYAKNKMDCLLLVSHVCFMVAFSSFIIFYNVNYNFKAFINCNDILNSTNKNINSYIVILLWFIIKQWHL
jgi:hypothetical protein